MEINKENVVSNLLNNIEKIFCPLGEMGKKECLNSKKEFLDSFEQNVTRFRIYILELINSTPIEAQTKLMHAIIVSNKAFAKLLVTFKNKNQKYFESERYTYLKILNFIEDTIDYFESIKSELIIGLPITDYRLSTVKFLYNEKLKTLQTKLSLYNIEIKIVELLLNELKNISKQKVVLRAHLAYAMELVSTIIISDNLSNERIEEILIEHNFNSPTFLQFYLNKILSLTSDNSSPHQQLGIIISLEEKLYNIIHSHKGRRLLNEHTSISDDLKAYYKCKKHLITQRIDISRTELLDGKLWDDNGKITLNTSVAQLGLLIRLFIDLGILPKDNIGKTFSFFTKHFRTPTTTFISTISLQKKSTTVEHQTAIKTKGLLLDMVKLINKDHNASHYSA